MATKPFYYEHSGQIGVVGPVLMVVFGAVACVVLGAAYGYLTWYNPFVYINFLASIGYGALCGVAAGTGGRWAKLRSAGFAALVGLLVGLFALYTGWVAWFYALSEQSYLAPLDPDGVFGIFDAMAEVARDGAWTMFGYTPTGGTLYAIWVAEAVIIVVCALAGAAMKVDASDNTFCDRCNRWAEDLYTSPLLTDVLSAGTLKAALERRDYGPLFALKTVISPDVPGSYTRVSVQGCTICRDFFCLDVERVKLAKDDDGDRDEKTSHLIDNLLINEALRDKLQQRFGRASR